MTDDALKRHDGESFQIYPRRRRHDRIQGDNSCSTGDFNSTVRPKFGIPAVLRNSASSRDRGPRSHSRVDRRRGRSHAIDGVAQSLRGSR